MTFDQRAHRAAESIRRAVSETEPRAPMRRIAWERQRSLVARAAVAASVVAAFGLGIVATRLWTLRTARPAAAPVVTQQVALPGVATSIATGPDAVWVGTVSPARVVRVDPADGRSTGEADLPDGARVLFVETGHASVWAFGSAPDTRSSAMVPVAYRLDPASGSILARLELPVGPTAAAVGEGSLWVADDRNLLSRIDPRSGRVVAQIDVGFAPAAVEVDPARATVWVVNRGRTLNQGSRAVGGSVSRVDVGTNTVTSVVPVGRAPSAIAIGRDVWVASTTDGTVSRIDPDTDRVVATIPVGAAPRGLVHAEGYVWAINVGDGTVSLIEARRNLVTATVPIGRATGAGAIAGSGLWVGRDDGLATLVLPE